MKTLAEIMPELNQACDEIDKLYQDAEKALYWPKRGRFSRPKQRLDTTPPSVCQIPEARRENRSSVSRRRFLLLSVATSRHSRRAINMSARTTQSHHVAPPIPSASSTLQRNPEDRTEIASGAL